MEPIFIILLFLTIYPYFIFPLSIIVFARLFGRTWEKNEIFPRVSMIISVYNEEEVIGDKISNALALTYPEDLLEIIILSDGSTDRTNEIVSSLIDPRIMFKPFPERKGKTSCLNLAVPEARGDILIFTDANSMFPQDTLLKISRNFSNDQIGLVTGWTKYRQAEGDEESVGIYARLEMVTKKGESMFSSCVGADGAIFAMRKELYKPLKDYDINDFVIPLNVIGLGKRVVLDAEVYCLEQPGKDEAQEYQRQVRITNRTLGAISRHSQYLNPLTYGSFTFFLISHKIIRFMVPFTFLGTFITSLMLANKSAFFAVFSIAQFLFIVFGIAGNFKFFTGRISQLCSYFLLTIFAQFMGWVRWATGKSDTMWKPLR